MLRTIITVAVIAAYIVALATQSALAVEIRKSGKISVPPEVGVVAFSTDALVANRLRQDFAAEHRAADANATSPLTLSVTVSQSPLRPGISLQDVAAGDPDVEALLKSAGATPPPVGDTGTDVDEVALARARAQNHMLPPGATPMQNLWNRIQTSGGPSQSDPAGCMPGAPCAPAAPEPTPPPPGSPGSTGDTQDYMLQGYEGASRRARQLSAKDFDNVIVARVSLSGSPDEMTVIAVTHPGEDAQEAKELIAEEIVNAVLH